MPERGRWSIALMPNRRFSGTVLAWMLAPESKPEPANEPLRSPFITPQFITR